MQSIRFDGSHETAKTVESFSDIADRCYGQPGRAPIFSVETNALTWLDNMLNAVDHANLFENRSTLYSRSANTVFETDQPQEAIVLQ